MSAAMPKDATAPPGSAVVEMLGIVKTFDELRALDGASFELREGEIHALLGENGAGKTTLTNVLAGNYRADAGIVRVAGRERHFGAPADAIEAGIGMVHQHFRLVDKLTVAENIHLGWSHTPWRLSRETLAAQTHDVMERFRLEVDPDALIWQLSIGEQQRVEILRVLAHGARVLILDEPTAVLTPEESVELFGVLRELAASGRSIVLISHKLREVLAVSHRITVLRAGRSVATCAAHEATAQQLAELMTGEATAQIAPRAERIERVAPSAAVLELRDVDARGDHGLPAVRQANVTVREGEIVGIAGVSGNGQRELAEVATGLRAPTAGRVLVGGADFTGARPRAFCDAGIGHVPEDRIGTAIVPRASVGDNAILRAFRSPELSHGWLRRRRAARAFARRLVDEASVVGADLDAPVAYLSGGNQQRMVVRREAWAARRALVAVHPTRGLDVHAAAQVRDVVQARRNAGCGVLLISDDLDEILAVSDRILVMYDGQIVGDFEAAQADRHEIGLLMGGGTSADAEAAR